MTPLSVAATDDRHSRQVLRTPLVTVGMLRCPPRDAAAAVGRASGHLLVFPRTPAAIRTEDRPRPILAEPSRALLYAPGQPYRRTLLDPAGHAADWFALAPPLAEGLAPSRGGVAEWPCSSRVYMTQRALLRAAMDAETPDPLGFEEAVVGMLTAARADAAGAAATSSDRGTRAAHAGVVDAARAVLAIRWRERITLGEVAGAAGVSVFHLCRIFRASTDLTVHRYLLRLRLLRTLGPLAEGRDGLTRIALDAGFASHSHFTAAFRREFGATPSTVRGRLRTRDLRRLSNRLTV